MNDENTWLRLTLKDGRVVEVSNDALVFILTQVTEKDQDYVGVRLAVDASDEETERLTQAWEMSERDDYADEPDGPNYEPVLQEDDLAWLKDLGVDGSERD